jgi:hypothetical protein
MNADVPISIVPSRSETGAHVFCVLVKRTYDVIPYHEAQRAERQLPLRLVDEYWDDGDPETCTVRLENDVAPYKPATDVVVLGKAYPPRGKPSPEVKVSVQIGAHRKTIQVLGDRRCVFRSGKIPGFTEPEPFTEMELRYERAYGGADLKSNPEMPLYYPRNTHGRGFALRNVREVIEGLPLPNLEDPDDLLTPERVVLETPRRWNAQPLPQGLGWFQRTWYPRSSFVGSVPGFVDLEVPMREETLGLVPKQQMILARRFKLPSFDVRFNNGASIGLAVPFLTGGEPVKLRHLTTDGTLEFRLPFERPRLALDLGDGPQDLPVVLHTVQIRPDESLLELVWRGAQEYPGPDWLPEMRRLHAELEWA